eukprot:UN25308
MKWKVRPENISEICLRFMVYDEEIGFLNTRVGGVLFWLNDVKLKKIGDAVSEEVCVRNIRKFRGLLKVDLSIRKAKGPDFVILKVIIKSASSLKKERGTDAMVDGSTAVTSIGSFICWICVVGTLFYWLEYEDNVNLVSWWDGFWFAFITATTVGYGDIYPVTDEGLYVNCFIMLIDVLIIGFVISIFVDFIAGAADRKSQKMGDPEDDMAITGVGKFIDKKKAEEAAKLNSFVETKSDTKKASRSMSHSETEYSDDGMRGKVLEFATSTKGSIISYITIIGLFALAGTLVWYKVDRFDLDASVELCFVTMSTVGYGDFSPTTDGSRIFCIFYILFGVGFMARIGGVICELLVEGQGDKIIQKIADEMLMHPDQILELNMEGKQDENPQIDKYEFMRALLIEMGKCRGVDFIGIESRFRELDVDGGGTITKEDWDIKKQRDLEALKAAETDGAHDDYDDEADY